jgi:serine/threonine protein kinase
MLCLEIDPETRFSASEAMEHPWIKAALHQSFKNHHRSEKMKPAKRMGQNESSEQLYQPQIIREREGVEIPTEFSPEREMIV